MRVKSALVFTAFVCLSAACERAGKNGDEHLERLALEHHDDAPVPSEATRAPSRESESWELIYASLDGEPVNGYLARPKGASGALPGIIVIHEWWGLNDNIRRMADRLASEGYAALAVDLFGGESAEDSAGARALVESALQDRERLERNLRQAYEFLSVDQRAPHVGTIGWCFGGGWSLATALMLPDEVDATVIYYGRLVTDPQRLETLGMPILGIFGSEDRAIPVESVRAFEQTLVALGKDATIVIYEGADHAFANPSGTRYQAEAATDAWEKTVAFFRSHLRATN